MKRPLYLIIIGPSGSGKGTQAKFLEKEFGLEHISMGEIFRKEIEKKTKKGKLAEKYVVQGKWVPTALTMSVLSPLLKKALKKGFILDGFPRLSGQPPLLDEFLLKHNSFLNLVIHLKVRPSVITERRNKLAQKGKGFYPNQKRKDESQAAIKKRLEEYGENINPILAYYKKRGILAEVNGERRIKPIHAEIRNRVYKISKENER
ncbi:MAG: nucleoside monophosphate kinase [Candidatus Shapirobacteria bacterium]